VRTLAAVGKIPVGFYDFETLFAPASASNGAAMFEAHMGARLAARRRALGLSEHKLAETLSIPETRLASWEAGSERIPASHLLRVAAALECDISYFFEGLPGVPRSKVRRYLRIVGGADLAGPDEDSP
jgi:hypothetical protein